MGITTTSAGLLSCHSSNWQCFIFTLLGILYRLLNSFLCSSLSTKLKKPTHLSPKKKKKKGEEKKSGF